MKKIQTLVSTILCLTLGLTTIFSNGKIVKADEDITKELKKEVVTLKTVDPTEELEDLMPLKKILKDKKVVGVGQSTYGSSEFLKMKHRMFKFMVEEMGFRALAMECNFGEGQVINDYILNGVGDQYSVMNSFKFRFWLTDEVKEMICWMREYNAKAKPKDKIRVYGFDMRMNIEEYARLSKYLDKVNPTLQKKFIDKISSDLWLDQVNKNGIPMDVEKSINEIITEFESSKEEMIERSSKEEYELMRQNLNVTKQCIELLNLYKEKSNKTSSFRSESMAANTKWIVDKEESLGCGKVMVWAHNWQINKREEQWNGTGVKMLGNNLDKMYGEKYYAIGFDFFKGKFKAYSSETQGDEVYSLKESGRETIGSLFNKLDVPIFYLDIKKALNNNDIKKWFDSNKVSINSIVISYDKEKKDNNISDLNIKNDYDALIFIKETSPAKKPVYDLIKEKEDIKNEQDEKESKKDYTKLIVIGSSLVILAAIVGGIVYKNKKKNISR